jgi:hypothetical protein
MALRVRQAQVLDRFHYNGDSFWDGDQTLYEFEVVDGDDAGQLLVVVPRGNEFIARATVAKYLEGMGAGLSELRARARRPAPDRRPQIWLPIESAAI